MRRIVNGFLVSTDLRKTFAGLPPTFDSITADQACNEKLYEESAGYPDSPVWFNGVKSNLHGIIRQRSAKRRGEDVDASAFSIYPTHVDKISEALMKEGSDHSATVNCSVLIYYYCGARPCETENFSLRGMRDDDEFNVTTGPLPQIKTNKTKQFSIPAVATRHRSWHFSYAASPWSAIRTSLEKMSPTLSGSSLNCNRWIIRARG